MRLDTKKSEIFGRCVKFDPKLELESHTKRVRVERSAGQGGGGGRTESKCHVTNKFNGSKMLSH